MSIANNIKRIRKEYGLTQTDLGKIAGVSDKAVSKWEIGSAEPRMGAVQKMADYFGIPKSKIIDEYGEFLTEREILINKAFADRPELRRLITAAEKLSDDDLDRIIKMTEALVPEEK